jgi:hypothetical protein
MRSLAIALTVLAFAGAANATTAGNPGVKCQSGVACGNTCIAKGQTCHIKRTTLATCKGGRTKPCGSVCIPVGRTCHQ